MQDAAQHAVDGKAVGHRGGDEIIAADELIDHFLIVQIDAELTDQCAAHLDHAHADENLFAALHLDEIDDARRIAARRRRARRLRAARAGRCAGAGAAGDAEEGLRQLEAWSASLALRAVPVSTTEAFIACAVTCAFGTWRRSNSLSAPTSGSTRISTLAIWRPPASRRRCWSARASARSHRPGAPYARWRRR